MAAVCQGLKLSCLFSDNDSILSISENKRECPLSTNQRPRKGDEKHTQVHSTHLDIVTHAAGRAAAEKLILTICGPCLMRLNKEC